ncbi:CG18048, partial [Drosophila busckii]
SAAKKIKMTEHAAAPADDHCAHYVHRKKRYCKMTPNKGSVYCGAHEPASEVIDDPAAERIPCPLDPKHTVFKRKLAKHLKICNARDQDSNLPYIVRNINAGEELVDVTEQDMEDYCSLKLHTVEDAEFYGVIDKVKRLYETHIANKIEQLDKRHSSLKEAIEEEDLGMETRRHLVQTSALLGILQEDQQLIDNTSFIEFGAGKGQLAFFLATALESQKLSNSQLLLIDRLSLRHKKDNKLTNKELVQRIRADIADLKMSQLPELQRTKRNVAISKHLCGAATDLTLRCALNDAACSADYILIALCCHHRCSWRSYVGKAFLQAADISVREFVIITKMVSWAVSGTGLSRERRKAMAEETQPPQESITQRLSLEEREDIGYQCKRMLDYGRVEFLRTNGFEASLKFYVPRNITLENVILLAR